MTNQTIDITEQLDNVSGGFKTPQWILKARDKVGDAIDTGKRVLGEVKDAVIDGIQPRPPLY